MPSGLCLPDLVGIGNGAVLGDSWGVEIEPCSPFPALRTTRPPEARQMMTMMMRGTEPPARQSKGKPSPILWPIERLLPVGVLIAFCIWAGRIFSLWNRQQYGVALKWNYWMCCVLWGWVGERERKVHVWRIRQHVWAALDQIPAACREAQVKQLSISRLLSWHDF